MTMANTTTKNEGFVHLHVHTEYSLLDGATRVKDLGARISELGQTAVAITDHGNMFGCLPAYLALKDAGIKPIIGCELYVSPSSRHEKSKADANSEDRYDHLILLAKNAVGYKNLSALCTIGYTEGFYYKPRIDDEVLAEHAEGLVCLSACVAGRIPKYILAGEYDKAKEKALYYKSLFGEDFYIEIQNHHIADEDKARPQLIKLAKEIGVKLVATNDAHYARKEDAEAQDILLCINTGAKVTDEKRFRFANDEFYLKSEKEMRELFPECEEAITNTAEVADKCNFEYELGKTKLPVFEIPAGYASHEAYFRYLCEKGMKERYGENPPQEYVDRMNYEIGVISKMGYVDYFLIVLDFINWAKDRGIPVGPGRGSGAGSICAYCTKITNIDPMRFNLFFERFLNPERVSMPDFDIDFCYERRGEVVDYVTKKYGTAKVSQIITYQTLAARASIKDVARAMGISYTDANAWAKLVPEEIHITIDKALESSAEFAKIYNTNPDAKKVIDIARKIEGIPKATSKHAAGVLICDKDIVNYAPLMVDDEGNQVIQATMVEVEKLGLLKFDFLGLRTLTVINDAVKDIKKNYGIDIDIDNINDADPEVFKMLSEGKTRGVFQLESGGMVSTLKGLKPESIEDLTALISLYRPGPMDSIPQYIQNKNNPEGIVYDDPRLKDILGVTYGVLVYQEQVMKLFQVLGGFSLGRSDVVRRAISKKKADVLEAEKRNFIYGVKDENGNVIASGALANGVPEETCSKIMDEVTAFASYAFNKSHAACYAVIAYQTAWLKRYYPLEFFAALLTSVMEKTDKLKENISSINKEEGIKILPPSTNVSLTGFSADKDAQAIRFGLAGLADVGTNVTNEMISRRNADGKFTSFYNFVKRMNGAGLNKKAYEALIKAGAFDWTGHNRRTLIENLADVSAAAQRDDTQLSLFEYLDDGEKYEEPTMVEYTEWPDDIKLKNEREVARLFLSGHPIAKCSKAIRAINALTASEVVNDFNNGKLSDGAWVTIAGVVFDTKKKMTKAGKPMALFTLQDETVSLSGIVFEKCLAASDFLFNDGTNIVIKGKIESRDDSLQLVANTAFGLPSDAQSDEVIDNFVRTVGVRRTKATPAPTPAPTTEPTPVAPAPKAPAKPIVSVNEQGQKRGLYIKMKDKSELSAYCSIIATIPGSLPVYLWDEEGHKMYSNPNFGVSLYDTAAIRKMQSMAGPGGMKVIK